MGLVNGFGAGMLALLLAAVFLTVARRMEEAPLFDNEANHEGYDQMMNTMREEKLLWKEAMRDLEEARQKLGGKRREGLESPWVWLGSTGTTFKKEGEERDRTQREWKPGWFQKKGRR